MKLCFFVEPVLVTGSGGAERVLRDLTGVLADRGHEVSIVTDEAPDLTPFYDFSPRVAFLSLRGPKAGHDRLASRFANALFRLKLTNTRIFSWLFWHLVREPARRRLEAHLAAAQPDIAVAFLPAAMVLLGLARTDPAIRKIASTHLSPERELEALRQTGSFPHERSLRLRTLRMFDRITVLLPEYRNWYPEHMRSRVRVVPNNIARPSEPVPWTGRRRQVVSVGRLVPQKRHDLLLKAWAQVAPRFPDWRLEIYGEGPLEAELRRCIRELGIEQSATLKGVTRDISAAYAQARLMAHTAEHEGFGLVIGEALANGLPVLGFADCPGLNVLVQHERNGRLVAPSQDRAAAFAAELEGLLATPDVLESLGAAGPASMEPYSLEAMADRWEEMFREFNPTAPASSVGA